MSDNVAFLEEDRVLRLNGRDEKTFNLTFGHAVEAAGDVRIHYVIGGHGP